MPSACLNRHTACTQYTNIQADETLKYIKEEKEEKRRKKKRKARCGGTHL